MVHDAPRCSVLEEKGRKWSNPRIVYYAKVFLHGMNRGVRCVRKSLLVIYTPPVLYKKFRDPIAFPLYFRIHDEFVPWQLALDWHQYT